jgi:alkylation response protein AidB-like acyl-CoA dehydrogenase
VRTPQRVEEGSLDFQLNDEQQHLKKSVREFAEREIAPNVMKWDEACEFPLPPSRNWASSDC